MHSICAPSRLSREAFLNILASASLFAGNGVLSKVGWLGVDSFAEGKLMDVVAGLKEQGIRLRWPFARATYFAQL